MTTNCAWVGKQIDLSGSGQLRTVGMDLYEADIVLCGVGACSSVALHQIARPHRILWAYTLWGPEVGVLA